MRLWDGSQDARKFHRGFDLGLGAVGQADQRQADLFGTHAQERQAIFGPGQTRLDEDGFVQRHQPVLDRHGVLDAAEEILGEQKRASLPSAG